MRLPFLPQAFHSLPLHPHSISYCWHHCFRFFVLSIPSIYPPLRSPVPPFNSLSPLSPPLPEEAHLASVDAAIAARLVQMHNAIQDCQEDDQLAGADLTNQGAGQAANEEEGEEEEQAEEEDEDEEESVSCCIWSLFLCCVML